MATITIKIAGSDVTNLLQEPGSAKSPFKFVEDVTQRNTCSFTILSDDGSYIPTDGQQVIVTHAVLGDIFGGLIFSSEWALVGDGTAAVATDCQCVGWEQMFDRRPSWLHTYTGTDISDIAKSVVDNSMGGDGFITTGGFVTAGVTIDFEIKDPRPSVRKVLDYLAAMAGNATSNPWVWDVTPDKHVRFYPLGTYPAPFNITDVDSHAMAATATGADSVSVARQTSEKRANRVFVHIATGIGDGVTQNFIGDGVTKNFTLSGQLALPPTIVLDANPVTGMTTPQTIGVLDVDTGKDWYYQIGSSQIIQDPSGTTLTSAKTLIVTYNPQEEQVAGPFEDAGAIATRAAIEGTTGYWVVVLEANGVSTQTSAKALASAYIQAYRNGAFTYSFYARDDGLRAGQSISVVRSDLGVNNTDMLIQRATLTGIGNDNYRWYIEIMSGALLADWKLKLTDQGSSSLNSVIGTQSGGGGNPGDLLWQQGSPGEIHPVSVGQTVLVGSGTGLGTSDILQVIGAARSDTAFTVGSTSPLYIWYVSGQPTDGKYWSLNAFTNLMHFSITNDAFNTSKIFMSVNRTGMTVNSMALVPQGGNVYLGSFTDDGGGQICQIHGSITLTGNSVTPFAARIWQDVNAGQGQTGNFTGGPGTDNTIIDNQGIECNFHRIKSHNDYFDWTNWGVSTSPLAAHNVMLRDSSNNRIFHYYATGTEDTSLTAQVSGTSRFYSSLRVDLYNHLAASLDVALRTEQNASGTVAGQIALNQFSIYADNANAGANPVFGWLFEHAYGGSAAQGDRNSFAVFSRLNGATSSSNADRNYVSGTFVAEALTGDGGTNVITDHKGAVFAIGGRATAVNGATALFGLTFMEADVELQTGSSAFYKAGVTIVGLSTDAVQGSQYDCMLGLSNETGAVGWSDAILLGDMNGHFPLASTGRILRTIGGSFAGGIDLSSSTISGQAFKSPGFLVDGPTGAVQSPLYRVSNGTDYFEWINLGLGAHHFQWQDSGSNAILDYSIPSGTYTNGLFAFIGNINATAIIQSTATGTNLAFQANGGTFQVLGNGLVGAANYNVGTSGTIQWNGQAALRYNAGHLQFSDNGSTWTNVAAASGSNWNVTGSDIYNANAGNVGIGGAPSGSYKLEVQGSIGSSTSLAVDDGSGHTSTLSPGAAAFAYGSNSVNIRVNTAPGLLVNGSQVVATRVSTTPVTLADVIAVLQHHGLSN